MSQKTKGEQGTERWLLLLDLDGTLWDHPDISRISPPLKKIGPYTIIDKNNTLIKIHLDTLEILRWAKNNNAITSTLSWNKPGKAIQALATFNLTSLFDYLVIEPHPRKDKMIKKLLERIRMEKNIVFTTKQIVYIDDRDIHIEHIRKNIGDIIFLQKNKHYNTAREAIKIIREKLNK